MSISRSYIKSVLKFWILPGLICFASALPAQIIKATGCVHKAGNDPSWAQADFDDRDWQTFLPPTGTRYSWTRCRLDLRSLSSTAQKQVHVGRSGAWEIFGFERKREMSAMSAEEITEAAKAWGQNDDITVVTVRRNG